MYFPGIGLSIRTHLNLICKYNDIQLDHWAEPTINLGLDEYEPFTFTGNIWNWFKSNFHLVRDNDLHSDRKWCMNPHRFLGAGELKATTGGLWRSSPPQSHKPCAIEAIPSKTYGSVWWWSPFVGTRREDEAHFSCANLRRPSSHIPISLWCNCSTGTRYVNLVETSFTDPLWWP